jgi:predicted nucleic acid-binding protein
MILVDTSIWVEHLRTGVPDLVRRLEAGEVLGHPLVTGELAMGNLRDRAERLGLLRSLPQATVATDAEVMAIVEIHRLHGRGVNYTDAHLLASTMLSDGARLWTGDRRLHECAVRLDVGITAR